MGRQAQIIAVPVSIVVHRIAFGKLSTKYSLINFKKVNVKSLTKLCATWIIAINRVTYGCYDDTGDVVSPVASQVIQPIK